LKPTRTPLSYSTIGRLSNIGSRHSHSNLAFSSKFNSFNFRLLYFVPRELNTVSIPVFSIQDLIEVEAGISFFKSKKSASMLLSLKNLKAFLTESQVFIP